MRLTRLAIALALLTSSSALPFRSSLTGRQQQAWLDLVKRNTLDPRQFPTFGLKQIPDADHPFREPSATAQRGPCPGLNVLANHGYLDREGITSFSELLYAQQEAMGWALDLSTFLAALAITVDGNPWNSKLSIGGPDSRAGSFLGQEITIPGGIANHNAFEIDASLTRNDVYFGDNTAFNGTLYQQLWDVADEMNNGVIDANVMAVVRSNRYQASVRDDPHFTFAPIGLLFFGADQLLWNTLVSSSVLTGMPGLSTRESLSEMYGAKQTGERTWTYVPERFPDQWYRRARPLTILELLLDAVPTVLLADVRGELPIGVSAASFASPEALTCAVKQVVLGQIPAALKGIEAFSALLESLGGVLSSC